MGIRKGWRYHQCKKLIKSAAIWGSIGFVEILLEVWKPSYCSLYSIYRTITVNRSDIHLLGIIKDLKGSP